MGQALRVFLRRGRARWTGDLQTNKPITKLLKPITPIFLITSVISTQAICYDRIFLIQRCYAIRRPPYCYYPFAFISGFDIYTQELPRILLLGGTPSEKEPKISRRFGDHPIHLFYCCFLLLSHLWTWAEHFLRLRVKFPCSGIYTCVCCVLLGGISLR
ncbi:hypothetical protein F4677DRAFT_179134 [Hypoxylon crocopeplum]|nr:hypothetical protein F4677DRAFT_179134 [Hypoxylon crocopeplum]